MELYFLSVGYGEAIVLIDGAHCLVMDGGPGSADEAYDLAGRLSAPKRRGAHRLHDLHPSA